MCDDKIINYPLFSMLDRELNKNGDVYYFKDFDKKRYRFNITKYYKLIKLYGAKMDLSKHLVMQKKITSCFPENMLETIKNDIFLCCSPDSFSLAALSSDSKSFSVYSVFPSFKMIFKEEFRECASLIDVALSESNEMLAFAIPQFLQVTVNIVSFKHNFKLTIVEASFSRTKRVNISLDDDTVVYYAEEKFPIFIRFFSEEPDDSLLYMRERVYRITSEEIDEDENIRDERILYSTSLEGNEKSIVRHYQGKETAKDDLFFVYFSPPFENIIQKVLKKRYTDAGKFVQRVTVFDHFVEVLGHDKYGITSGIHCLFNAQQYPNCYYTMIRIWIPSSSQNPSNYKTRVGELIGVKPTTTIKNILQNKPEFGLSKYRTAPFSTYKHFSTNCIESINSIEPQNGGIEYMLVDPDPAEIAKLPSIDLKSRFL